MKTTGKQPMTVRELIDFLNVFPLDAQVILDTETNNVGYANIKSLTPGAFVYTDYGNDFYPHQNTLKLTEAKAVCLTPYEHDFSEE